MRLGVVLSLTGRFARFGTQAADALRVWSGLVGDAGGDIEVEIADDAGQPGRVGPALQRLAADCDLLLGPYGTSTARAAARFAAETGRLVWNHGGSGDDVQAAAPGRFVSVISPTSRAGEPFARLLAQRHPGLPLRLHAGEGTFGPQVVAGVRAAAERLGVPVQDAVDVADGPHALFSAGRFEDDVAVVASLAPRPVALGTPAAGVQGFAEVVDDPDGVYGVAQWVPGGGPTPDPEPDLGPSEDEFLAAWAARVGGLPDYPAVQAVATAAIARHCLDEAGPDGLWDAAVAWRGTTLYGRFGIDPGTGAQRDHQVALVRWEGGRLTPQRLDP